MKKFFREFKTFITRGNVMDMAVGVIIGGAFTAIVTALTNNIIRPFINWIVAAIVGNPNEPIYTILKEVRDSAGNIDLAASIYIDWGALIGAIINFLLIAFILFLIIKTLNTFSENQKKLKDGMNTQKQAVKKYKAEGLSRKEAIAKYKADLKAQEEAKAQAEAEAQEKARIAQEEKELANTRLLEEIRDLLKNKN